jgi:hypothetical protein
VPAEILVMSWVMEQTDEMKMLAVALHDFFVVWMEDMAFEEAEVELIYCCEQVDLVYVVLGAIFELCHLESHP